MKPVLYEYNETDFTNQGIGVLVDAISCYVEEKINSTYELTMVYPTTGKWYEELKDFRLILSTHDDTGEKEPFEIYKISKPMNGKVTVNAWHVSYRLRRITCSPFQADNLPAALGSFLSAAMTTCNFTFTTTRTTAATMKIETPTAMRSVLGGVKGSFLDVYGGEWKFKRFDCELKNRLGRDTDYSITYGRNLISAKAVSDATNVWTGIVPFWKPQDGNAVYYSGVIESAYADSYPYPMIVPVDCTESFEDQPSQDQLLAWGESYVEKNAPVNVPKSFDVDSIALWQTEEYRQRTFAERLALGDTLSVYYEELGIDDRARICGTKYDVLAERFSKMTIGSVASNLANTIKTSIDTTADTLSPRTWVNTRLKEQTNLITGGLGGYVVMILNDNGQPQELVFMDSPDIETATNCIRINKEGIGFSTDGYHPESFTSAWTIDGHFNASFIDFGLLNGNLIRTGMIVSADGQTYWDLDNNIFYIAAQSGSIQGAEIETSDTTAGVRSDVADILQHFVINEDASLQIVTSNGMSITLSQGTVTVTDAESNETLITGMEVETNVVTVSESLFVGNHKWLARSNGTNTTMVYVGD